LYIRLVKIRLMYGKIVEKVDYVQLRSLLLRVRRARIARLWRLVQFWLIDEICGYVPSVVNCWC